MKLFEELTQLHGVSGYETAVADYIKEKLVPLADDITTDPRAASASATAWLAWSQAASRRKS